MRLRIQHVERAWIRNSDVKSHCIVMVWIAAQSLFMFACRVLLCKGSGCFYVFFLLSVRPVEFLMASLAVRRARWCGAVSSRTRRVVRAERASNGSARELGCQGMTREVMRGVDRIL